MLFDRIFDLDNFFAPGTSVPCAQMIHQWYAELLLPNWANLQKF